MNVGRYLAFAAVSCALSTAPTPLLAESVGTAFTYQGQLKDSGVPVNDTCEFEFGIWDAGTNGSLIGSNGVSGVEIVDGLFSVQLDFGPAALNGDARWLEIDVKGSGDAEFTALTPRQELTPTPYATFASSAAGGWGGGTAETVPKLTSGGTLTDSVITEDQWGQIAIGPPSLSANLSVNSSDSTYVRITTEDQDSTVGLSLYNSDLSEEWTITWDGRYDQLFVHSPTSMPLTIGQWGDVGIATYNPQNRLDVNGMVAVGSGYAATYTAPENGMIVEGDVGIGTSSPRGKLEVQGTITQLDSGPANAYGKTSVLAQEGTLDGNGDFTIDIGSAYYQAWHVDNYIFKVEVFVSLDYSSSHPHMYKGSAYSEALVGKQRGDGLAHIRETETQSNDAVVTFAYSNPGGGTTLRITVNTNRPNGIPYRATVKISR
jgi:hypothetical protein